MKILKLKIKTPKDEIIKEIKFYQSGVSYIYGDIKYPEKLGATINSLGKTLLLKFIDYIFGANEDKKVIKEAINGYKLEAIVLHNFKEFKVTRILGNPDSIYINNENVTLTDYKKHFSIRRSLYNKQLILNKKSTEISYITHASKDDVISCLELLGLSDILDKIDNIYKSQDRIQELKKNKKELISFYGEVDVKQIDEQIYFIDKEVERLDIDLEKIAQNIKSIEISDIQKNIVDEYSLKSNQLKKLKTEYEIKKFECERLDQFIEDSNKVDISSKHLLAIFEKAKQEVPEMVKRNFHEVEEFHKSVYEERKEFLNQKKDKILLEMGLLNNDIEQLSNEIDSIGAIISKNEIYQESIGLYEKYSKELQELKYKQGKLSQVKSIDNEIFNENANLSNFFNEAIQLRKNHENLIITYRNFIFDIVKTIYTNDVTSYFDIRIRPKNLKNRPVIFEFTLKGDAGEGVGEVKKNLMDYLICMYSNYLEILIQDSSCYNGIDPRQVTGMLNVLHEIGTSTDKQIIVAINKYQLGNYKSFIEMVEKNSSVILSEQNKLLGVDF
ncbi:DUF2326 domain-containing protein [Gilliamella sp. W8128]|uniref:DUF2326 domain-containing protein n=1 Tax=Gilliamella sp. W8128 TaxID=2751010 RepID=UPI0018DDFFFB|nr:DUF2326 domain-containing protein [Gilliamella sp. W8128]MBI0153770.1 DUF2326 domain-containing protein [Gilliamella sp. W8128]